jgi:UDP-N-acetylglucosamine--dolichyl-phosphate N-acetylglucosaminephosphotransferase
MELLLSVSILISYILTWIVLPTWIKKCRKIDLLWEDMNKFGHPRNVAVSGGLIVVLAFTLGILSYVALRTFIIGDSQDIIIKTLSLLSVVLILAIVGLVDDLLGWKHGGLSWKLRIVLAFIASIPLVVINAGEHNMNLPFLGLVPLGLFYTLILVPIGIAGATTTYNFLAGMRGLEAGQGIIILSFLSLVAYLTGSGWLALIGLIMVASLIVFYYYNVSLPGVFPGDIGTYSIGALIACMAILGNFEKIAVFMFTPYILETLLKAGRGRLKKQSFGIPDKKNNLKMPYEKIYGLTHLSIFILSKFKKEVRERDVTYFIFGFQILICLLTLLITRNALF